MRPIKHAFLAIAAIGVGALSASTAGAQVYVAPDYGYYGAYDSYAYRPIHRSNRYYSYGANRANPSFGPMSYDQTNPRDQQLQGHN